MATRSGYADVHGALFYYEIFGDLNSGKTPLLVLHGSYMSSEAMAPIIHAFAATRPVIAFDARGHGRTGDLPGPITYPQMADDAAGVLDALGVRLADVLGYSMGGVTALQIAVRHPDKVGKQIIVSGTSRRTGWLPEINAALEKVTPEAFAGSPLETAYKKLSPTPNAFPLLVEKQRGLDVSHYDLPDETVRAIRGKTMIVVGDTDGVQLEHALALFKLRGGDDPKVALQSIMMAPPPARLLVLPATTHVGIMANAQRIAELAAPFLDDVKPTTPHGFFKE
jgi:pimeloyl-ACP methyl ester carboxylesterase